ncbi:cytochrome C biogenesis protein [Rothia sp. HMSC065G12]|nr:cytochrome C biogenesis protein [Rothia sp. HMSC065G12]
MDAKTFALVNPAAARRLAPTAPQTQDVIDNHSASAPITTESKAQTPNEYAVTRRKATWRLLAGVALFIAGFSAIFVLLSVVLAQLGAAPWLKGQSWVTMILGALVVLMGIVFLGGLSIFQTDKRLHRRSITGLWGAPILGITFGLGWAPCIGPTFAAVQTLVYTGGSGTGKAVVLTLAYCLGLGVPFLLVAWGMGRGVSTLAWARKHRLGIQRVGGAVLILIGVLLMTGLWTELMSWIQAALPAYELPI